MEIDLNTETLAQSVGMLWAPLTDEQRELLAKHVSARQLKQGSILFREGETPQYLYYLLKGKVSILRNGLGGQQQIVRMVEPGAIFGYVAAFDGGDYRSTAVAGNETTVLQIPLSLIFHFVWENSNFAMFFLKELSSLLGLSIERTMYLTQKHIRGRLAEILLHMRDKYGVEGDGHTLAVYLSRDELAKMSNMTTSNAIRTLSAFAQEGLITIEGRKIRFIDIQTLKHISELG